MFNFVSTFVLCMLPIFGLYSMVPFEGKFIGSLIFRSILLLHFEDHRLLPELFFIFRVCFLWSFLLCGIDLSLRNTLSFIILLYLDMTLKSLLFPFSCFDFKAIGCTYEFLGLACHSSGCFYLNLSLYVR